MNLEHCHHLSAILSACIHTDGSTEIKKREKRTVSLLIVLIIVQALMVMFGNCMNTTVNITACTYVIIITCEA